MVILVSSMPVSLARRIMGSVSRYAKLVDIFTYENRLVLKEIQQVA
jgi:hypothetical protein